MPADEHKTSFDLQTEKISQNIQKITNRIVVFSGKGGVGKTTVSVNLAYGLNALGLKTGILDADITGPNVPKMLGLNEVPLISNEKIVPQTVGGVKVISMANMIPDNQAVIWRGPMRSKLINQFLADVEWGPLDYLIADLPPGTGDEIMTITQQMKPTLAVIVTTPQEMSLIDSARAISMSYEIKIPKIALIENMSNLICPDCGTIIDLFGSGGGKTQAEETGIPFLGALPIDIETRKLADTGKPIVTSNENSDISREIMNICKNIIQLLRNESHHNP